jgi:predicted nucleotidyltransferase
VTGQQPVGESPVYAGRVVTLDDVRRRRETLRQLAVQYGVTDLRVFGSVARGEAVAGSDLDLLVSVLPGHGLFRMNAFAAAVEELLQVPVQLATERGLRPRVRQRVLAEAVPL